MSSKARTPHILIVLLLLLATACTKPPQPQVVPTLAVLPSVTPTETPTDTPIPTWTDSPTPTLTPSDTPTLTATFTETPPPTFTPSLTFTPSYTHTFTPTPTHTPTSTYTPTDTLTPTATDTFTPTPTDTFTPTPSNTPTPLPTATPTFTATIAAPEIVSFGTTTTSVPPNSSVTFAWMAVADAARLELLGATGNVIQSLQVVPTGQFTLVVPGSFGRIVYYRLVVIRNGIERVQTIPITIVCQYNWFFGNQYAPPNTGCPASGLTSDGRFQSFERGLMFYVSANGLNHIYGLQNENSLYLGYTSAWDGSTLNSSPPPDGRFMPQEMFNWAYYSTLAPIGSWSSALGWGTEAIVNQPRTMQWENAVGGSNPFYIDAPDGAVYRFSGGDSGTWNRVR